MPSQLKILQTNTFDGGMDSDTALELLENNKYRRGLNIHVLSTAGGQRGIVTNCKGTTEIEFDLPEGDNVAIGKATDEEKNKFYWFNWNSEGYHGVYMYDSLLNKVTPVLINLQDTGDVDILQFAERTLILHVDIIRSPNLQDLIYWADGQVKQKKFNIQKALDKTATGYGQVILAEYINAYKLAAIFPPVLSYFTDTSRETNYLYTSLFKASVRHWYDDGEKNNWSEFSTVPLPVYSSPTTNIQTSSENNGLKITVETGSSIVKQIEIAVQIGTEPFVSVIVLDKSRLGISDNTTYEYSFYNDNSGYSGLDQLKVYRAYSFMPRLAALQAFTRNALVYGKGLEGFEAVDIDVSVSVLYSDLFLPDGTTNELNDPFFNRVDEEHDYVRLTPVFGLGNSYRRNTWVQFTVGHDVKTGNTFNMYGRNGESDNLFFYYTATLSDDAVTVASYFKQQLVATGRIIGSSEDLPDADIWENEINVDGDVTFTFIWKGHIKEQYTSFSGTVNPVSFATLKDTGQSMPTQKSGGSRKYGIVYWNEDTQRSNTYTSDECFVRTDFVTQTDGYKSVVHEITIMHQPPVWAKYYEIVRTLDLTYGSDFIHILIQKAIESQSTTDTEYVDLIIGSLYTYQEMYPNTVVRYEFEKNDRVRLIKKEDSDTFYDFIETIVLDFKPVGTTETIDEEVTVDNTSTVVIGGTTSSDNIGRYIVIDDVERLITAAPTGTTYTLDRTIGTDDGTGEIKYNSFKIIDKRGIIRVRKPVNITIEDNSLIEVYKPTQNVISAEKEFYLFGQKYAITNWGTDLRAHTGNVQNQDPTDPITVPAIVDISKGTTYVRQQQFPTNNQVPDTQVIIDLKESYQFSDFYESTLNDNGKISVEDDGSGEKRFGSRARFSNNYIEGTRINGLNDFDNLDRKDYNDPYGDFMLFRFREKFLFAFKQLKTGYIPILATVIVDENQQEILGSSKQLLNELQYFAWEGGVGNNPESYTSDQTWQWFLSPNSGTDCRIGGDGILPTSKQFFLEDRIRGYIKNAVKYSTFIHGGFDGENDERLLNFENYNEYLYNGAFDQAYFQLYHADYPEGTEFEITTQPLHGTVVIDSNGFFLYTPDPGDGYGSDGDGYTGPDYFYYRWRVPDGEWTEPKRSCGYVNAPDIPAEPDIYYNVEYSENFTKNDCDSGYHGSEVPYVVPALKWSSPYSQADADLQAQNDAAVNGQAYANTTGTCSANEADPWSFSDLTGLEIDTLTESAGVVISGDYDFYPISVANLTYQIDGGAWTAAAGLVPDGSTVKIRRTTSSSYSTAVTGTVIIGGVPDVWSITTRAANNVTVNYAMVFGSDPTTAHWNVIERIREGVTSTIATIQNVTSGTLPAGDFKEGDTITVYQGAYDVFMWAPDSSVNLTMDIDAVEYYNAAVASQSATQNTPAYVIEPGVAEIDITSTGSSNAVGYVSESLHVENAIAETGILVIDITDNSEVGLGLDSLEPPSGTNDYPFNVLGTAGTLTVVIHNTGETSIDYELNGEGGYTHSGTIAAFDSVTWPDVTKGGVEVIITAS